MKTQHTLNEILSMSTGMKILFLGKENIFIEKEIIRYLKKYDIAFTKTFEESVVATIEHHRLNPIEEEISYRAYDAKIPSFSLESFEKLLSKEIDNDELIMGIKLSNDQARIFRLLGNEHLSETLFVKLLTLYEWHHEEEDNTEDRDVIMYTLCRYIETKPNETDLLYSYLTLRRLATETTNPKLLLALLRFQNFEFHIRGKEKITLRETIARNRFLDKELLLKLISLKDKKVERALAGNTSVALASLQMLLAKNDTQINIALSSNNKIDNKMFEILLDKEDEVVQHLLFSQPIDKKRLAFIISSNISPMLFSTIGANVYLDFEVIDYLLTVDNEALLSNLAENHTLGQEQLESIYQKKIPSTFACLASNPSIPSWLLKKLYENHNNADVRIALAGNIHTPVYILRTLFDRDELEIYQSMASNASVPLDILDMLKVDIRLQNALAKNPILIKGYETVLDYDKKAVQF
ncbi:MAG: hypothetical protein DSZ09_01975 [Sulfurovum sp.]|nr:MAG: hypothetical protein DSZ09_01975 [Sulfurovum sp.]